MTPKEKQQLLKDLSDVIRWVPNLWAQNVIKKAKEVIREET